MQNVKLAITKRKNIIGITTNTVGVTQLIGAVSVTADRSIEDVTSMMQQDNLLPLNSRMDGAILDLQRSYWRQGDWFDDGLKQLMVYNRVSKLIIVEAD